MYLYNKSKNIIDLPTGETLFPGCFSSYISDTANSLMQSIIRSGMVKVLNDLNRYEAVGYRIPLCYAGNIAKSNEFPSRLEVQDGMLYIITADTTDGNPEKTNTGKTFEQGQSIIWYHGDWREMSKCTPIIDNYTKVLLHCDGIEGSTVFTDSSSYAHAITANGNAHIDTSHFKFGGASAFFDGAGSFLNTAPNLPELSLGSSDFCFDFWFRASAPSVIYGLFALYNGSEGEANVSIVAYMNGSGGLGVSASNGSSWIINTATTNGFADSAWHHATFVRKGSAFYIYVDGTMETSISVSGSIFTPATYFLHIGKYGPSSYYFNGYIDEFRVSIGSARIDDPRDKLYIPSGNPEDGFTPPTSAYGS